jgi:hypothetical protein
VRIIGPIGIDDVLGLGYWGGIRVRLHAGGILMQIDLKTGAGPTFRSRTRPSCRFSAPGRRRSRRSSSSESRAYAPRSALARMNAPTPLGSSGHHLGPDVVGVGAVAVGIAAQPRHLADLVDVHVPRGVRGDEQAHRAGVAARGDGREPLRVEPALPTPFVSA